MIRLGVLCDAGVHCPTCRDPGAAEWRASVRYAFDVPAGEWECPRGLPWGHGSPGPIVVHEPEPLPAVAAGRLDACRACDHYNGNVCERQFPCGVCLDGWWRWLRGPASRCPHPGGSKWPDSAPLNDP